MNRIIIHDMENVLSWIEQLEQYNSIQTNNDWKACQHFTHCGQSILCSISGYPKLNSPILRKTIGKLVFNYFAYRGYVKHDINKTTPGLPAMKQISTSESLQFFKDAVIRFEDFKGPFYPHHFYGKLSKKEFEKVHAMHFANHLESFNL